MSETRYRHWKNHPGRGEQAFVTTTTLDHARLFQTDRQKNLLTRGILRDLLRYGAGVQAYVTMVNHVHLLLTLPDDMDIHCLMKQIKRNAESRIYPLLDQEQRDMLAAQTGLNNHTFWQRSFRSIRISTIQELLTKVDYIHGNPIRAGLCQTAEEYRWSSAFAFAVGCIRENQELDIRRCGDLYR